MERFVFSDMAYEMPLGGGDLRPKEEQLTPEIRRCSRLFTTEEGQKEVRTYLLPPLWKMGEISQEELIRILAEDLLGMIRRSMKSAERKTVLVIGLGNPLLGPDALGSKTVEKVLATRIGEQILQKGYTVACFSPNVYAHTGMEASEVAKGICDQICPGMVLAVDALAAKCHERLGSAIQFSELGVRPGGGIGAGRRELSVHTLGVPVLSVGIPTVVRASTLIVEALKIGGALVSGDAMERHLTELEGSYVTPKEIDWLINEGAFVLASAINLACGKEES